jgi:uncharacterized membrane protein
MANLPRRPTLKRSLNWQLFVQCATIPVSIITRSDNILVYLFIAHLLLNYLIAECDRIRTALLRVRSQPHSERSE